MLILSCTRIEAPPQGVSLGTEKLPGLDSIPLEWGKLVSVSTTPIYQGTFQLWFQEENGRIRMVPYTPRGRYLTPNAVVIPRK
jgi:hypothetical protein